MKKDKITYKQYTFALNKKTIELLKKVKKEKQLTWNLLFNELVKNMGILDFVPRKELNLKQKGDIELNCEKCGRKFLGYNWMIKIKKSVLCPQCFKDKKRDEENEGARSDREN